MAKLHDGPPAVRELRYRPGSQVTSRKRIFQKASGTFFANGSYALFQDGVQVQTGIMFEVSWPNLASEVTFELTGGSSARVAPAGARETGVGRRASRVFVERRKLSQGVSARRRSPEVANLVDSGRGSTWPVVHRLYSTAVRPS